MAQESVQGVLLLRRLQLADQLRRREEEHPQTRTTRRLAQGHGDVRLARSVAPDKTTIVLVFNPFASRQLQDLGLGKLRQDAEVVGVEVLQHRELRVLDPRRHRVGSAGLQLDLGQAEQKLDEGLIGRGGVGANRSNSWPIVGSRNCRKWVLSNSIVTSAIGASLSMRYQRTGESGLDDRSR